MATGTEDMDVSQQVNRAPHQPQEDAKIDPPKLPENHVCITFTQEQEDFAVALELALKENNFKVKTAGPGVKLTMAEMNCLKVIMMVSRQYLTDSKYKEEIQAVEQLTSMRQQEILIPVLCGIVYDDLPPRLKEGSAVPNLSISKDFPLAGESTYWKRVVEGIEKNSPILSSVTNGVGYGLAWGHFFGYLQFILTDLSNRIRTAPKDDWDIPEGSVICDKMIAIIPQKGRLLRSLGDYDPEITSVTSKSDGNPVKVKHAIDFPGHPRKDYSCGMFKMSIDNKNYVFFAEVPATLNTLAKMRDSTYVTFSEDDFQMELVRVQASLENILRTHKDEHINSRLQSIAFVTFDDRTLTVDESRGSLSREIARVIDNSLFLKPD